MRKQVRARIKIGEWGKGETRGVGAKVSAGRGEGKGRGRVLGKAAVYPSRVLG